MGLAVAAAMGLDVAVEVAAAAVKEVAEEVAMAMVVAEVLIDHG